MLSCCWQEYSIGANGGSIGSGKFTPPITGLTIHLFIIILLSLDTVALLLLTSWQCKAELSMSGAESVEWINRVHIMDLNRAYIKLRSDIPQPIWGSHPTLLILGTSAQAKNNSHSLHRTTPQKRFRAAVIKAS